jgi:hypothetical protein
VSKFVSSIFIGAGLIGTLTAAPPPKLPGEDITAAVDELASVRDTAALAPPVTSPHSAQWLETVMKTWDAPSLSQQIDEDDKMVPVGKGGIFVPRFSDPALEPTIQINDQAGKLYKWGETGKKYTVEPGEYSIVLGSGSMNQRIVKKLTVAEGRVMPLIPDWCGLSIDVVDESNLPFRGVYEIARLDSFEAYGRSYGREMTLGERVKTWILKPGLYKIFTAGGSYNTLTNFITVRLVPGEFVRVIIIENKKDLKVIGGGVVNAAAVSSHHQSRWSHNLNVGGTILFNANKDRVASENTVNLTDIAFLTLFDLVYKKGSIDWETNIFWKEGLNFSDLFLSDITYTGDDFRITSLAVWRVILPWLGPYCRTEFRTHFFPVYTQFEKNAPNHYFIILNPDTTLQEIDAKNTSKEIQPTFSPLTAEVGVGTNIDMLKRDNYDAKLQVGIGYSQMYVWNQKTDWNPLYQTDTSNEIFRKINTDSALWKAAVNGNYKILYSVQNLQAPSYGPEFGLSLNIRAGAWAVARGDIRTRIPLGPLINKHKVTPDVDINSTVSWTLTHSITLDYLYLYTLKQPIQDAARVNQSSHSIFLRFSLSSR